MLIHVENFLRSKIAPPPRRPAFGGQFHINCFLSFYREDHEKQSQSVEARPTRGFLVRITGILLQWHDRQELSLRMSTDRRIMRSILVARKTALHGKYDNNRLMYVICGTSTSIES